MFISATSADLGSYRQVVKDALLTLGAHPIEESNFLTDYRELERALSPDERVKRILARVQDLRNAKAGRIPANAGTRR